MRLIEAVERAATQVDVQFSQLPNAFGRCFLTLGAAGVLLGTLDEIWPTPGHDVLVLRQGGETRLVPASDGVIVRFDRTSGDLWLDPPEQSRPGRS